MAPVLSLISQLMLAALVHGHGVITNAQGEDGSPASVGFQVDPAIARNCTTINPCQQDATIIRDAEITANIVNQCGRTELSGNIDVGENTENALAAGAVTQVKAGSQLTVTIHQVNADGAGPYACDLDETSNTGTITQNLTVTNNVPGANGFSQAKAQAFNITVQMPDSFTCTGASTGNVCTVRCRNNALAGPFGGCFAVQQIDTEEKTNVANNIQTIQKLDAVLAQIQQNQADFEVSVKANADAGSDSAAQNLAAVNAILQNTIVTGTFAQQTPTVINDGGAGNTLATSVVSDVATTSAADNGAGNDEVITSAITPATPAQTDDAQTGDDTTNDDTDDTNDNNNNNNGNGRNGRNRNNNNNNNNNAANDNAEADATNGNGNNGRFRNNVGRAMRWAKRV